MNPDDLEPLPTELASLLRQARPGVEPPAEAKEAVLAFVAANAVAGGAAGLAAGAASAATRGAGAGASVASRTGAAGLWALFKGSFGVGGIVLGVAVGAAGHAAYVAAAAPSAAPASALPVTSATPVGSPVVGPPKPAWTAVPTVSSAPTTGTVPTATPRGEASGAERGRDTSLAAERAIIDMARTAVARGQGEPALAAVDRHEREFPHGRLAEEREWLAIQALVLTGARDAAKQRAARFRDGFPRSLMLPALDQVLSPPSPPSPTAGPPPSP
jgi:hypothetical protein